MNEKHGLLTLIGCVVVTACAGGPARTLSLSSYASSSGDDAKAWKGLQPGNKYVLFAPKGSCSVARAASRAELEQGGGQAVAGTPEGEKMSIIEITDAYVRTGSDAFAALEVKNEAGEKSWLKLPAGGAVGCLQAVPAGLEKAREMVGKQLAFNPSNPECAEIEAAGRAPGSMLVESEGDVLFKVEGLALGPASAQALASGKTGNTLWAVMGNGSLKVRVDTLPRCFSAVGENKQASGPLALLRMPATRCEENQDEGRSHVECRSTVGIWEGAITDSAVELRAVRRTLGPIHFLDGKLVNGARYARTVVAVAVGSAPDPRRQRLYQQLTPAISQAMARDGGGVRVADASSPDVTYKIGVELSEINISDLAKSDVPETSKYKVRDDVRPNPDKPAAQQRVQDAQDKLTQAEQDYQNEKQQFDQLKRQAIDECNAQANKATNAWEKMAATTGCAAADALIQPSDSGVQAARKEQSDAQTALAGMPDTITVPIMADWSYTKHQYSRTARGTLSISLQPTGNPTPKVFQTPMEYTWTDYEVAADGAHNVQGHTPDRGPIDDPEALVPYIANAASSAIATRFRSALADAQIEAARRAMAAAGIEASKPGYETVDALAFDVVGTRLEKPLLRGGSQLAAGKAVPLPSDALSLTADQCLLAVAAGANDAPLSLTLRTTNGSHADTREGGLAMVEICQNELSHGKMPGLELTSKAAGDVRWTLYRVRAAAPAGGGT